MQALFHSWIFLALTAAPTWGSQPWDNDVYCGRHFNDLVVATTKHDDVLVRPAILVLYDNTCKATVTDHFDNSMMPPPSFFALAKHNLADADFHIWYGLDEVDNLRDRYNFTQCPDVMFFPEGGKLSEPERIESGEPIATFVWKKFKLTVKLINREDYNIKVKFKGSGPTVHTTIIQPGQQKEVRAYKSYFMTALRGQDSQFLMGQVLNATGEKLTIVLADSNFKDFLGMNAKEWEMTARGQQIQLANDKIWWRRMVSHSYLLGFKQPVLLPKFSKDMKGYEKRKMPKEVYDIISEFYRKTRPTKLEPEPGRVEPAINDDEVKCGLVSLTDDVREEIADLMLPVMEAWAGCRLRMTYFYGIREYYKGNILRNHVDRVETHIVSVILQIDQDLGGQRNWELEIVDFDGDRKTVTLEPGEMLLYESATLIHGRPYPFQGNVFANAFLHYMPMTNWRWRLGADETITNGTIEEPIDRFVTVNTAKFNQFNVRHRWRDLPYRDEL